MGILRRGNTTPTEREGDKSQTPISNVDLHCFRTADLGFLCCSVSPIFPPFLVIGIWSRSRKGAENRL